MSLEELTDVELEERIGAAQAKRHEAGDPREYDAAQDEEDAAVAELARRRQSQSPEMVPMPSPDLLRRMRACAPLLPPPGDVELVKCLDWIDALLRDRDEARRMAVLLVAYHAAQDELDDARGSKDPPPLLALVKKRNVARAALPADWRERVRQWAEMGEVERGK